MDSGTCICMSGYFDDDVNVMCNKSHSTCIKCSKAGYKYCTEFDDPR